MTTRVFIAGSLTIRHLDPKVRARIDNILAQDFDVIVGDADGVDAAVQRHLFDHGATRTTVYCSGTAPRNNVGRWPVRHVESRHAKGSRAWFTAKDVRMADDADIGLMIWDAKSTGTLNNVVELVSRRKKAVVFIDGAKVFKNVATVEELEDLVSYLSGEARRQAADKIALFDRIGRLKHEQAALFA